MQEHVQEQAQLVIVGAGIVGCSAAYHLTKLGWRDILVLDKGPIFENDGSTSHAPGGMHLTNASEMMTRFADYSTEVYASLPYEGDPIFRPVGGIEVAYTKERWEDLKRKLGWAKSYDLEAYLISPREVKDLVPILDENVIHGGFYVPGDANVNGWGVARALAQVAEESGGATFRGETEVIDFVVEKGRVTAVITNNGRIQTDQVLLCANIWAPALSQKLGIPLPLLAAEHQYTISTPLPELAGEPKEIRHPIMRHQDFSMYFRQHWDRYGVGSYRHEPLMVEPRALGKTAMKPFTPQHFQVAWRAAGELLPPLQQADLETKFNGMFAFTVDGFPIMGEAPNVCGFWAATGVWITHAGGVGKAIAEWMSQGAPSMDVHEAHINRFQGHQTTRKYIHLRCAQNYREVYDIIHPLQQMDAPRNIRLAPFHSRLQEQDGVFFSSAGWETAQWYEANAPLLEKYGEWIPERSGWEARHWSRIQGAEHLATRDGVGMFNVTPLAVIEVDGPGALPLLEKVAANRVERPVGGIVYTTFLDEKGGVKSDLTIVRLGEERFWVLTGGGRANLDLAWLRRHAPDGRSPTITDLTSAYCAIGLWGPKARQVLGTVAEEDVSNEAFPFYTGRPVTIDAIRAYALRLSYAGELGWEIYAPMEQGLRLWDALWQAGEPHGVIAAGGGAFNSLRLEKGYRLWGTDIHPGYNPYEAGLGWTVKLGKGDFIGRQALRRIKEEGITRRLCCLTLDDPGAVAMGKEPILHGEQKLGYVTSAAYGYSVGQFIVYGYLPTTHAAPGTNVEIEYFAHRHPATVVAEPLFDPEMKRLKG